jgi:uncharacterized protein YciI
MEEEMKKHLVLIVLLLCTSKILFAQTEKPQEKKTFIYVLHIVPKYLDVKTWTDTDKKVVKEHMDKLRTLFADGTLLHAGKTDKMDEKTLGIVIYYAESIEKAKEIADADPAVKAGMMTAEVFSYRNILMRDSAK